MLKSIVFINHKVIEIKNINYLIYFVNTINFILLPVYVRWSMGEVTRIWHDQPHHFYTKLVYVLEMSRVSSYFYS
jgi:hypothetical protein